MRPTKEPKLLSSEETDNMLLTWVNEGVISDITAQRIRQHLSVENMVVTEHQLMDIVSTLDELMKAYGNTSSPHVHYEMADADDPLLNARQRQDEMNQQNAAFHVGDVDEEHTQYHEDVVVNAHEEDDLMRRSETTVSTEDHDMDEPLQHHEDVVMSERRECDPVQHHETTVSTEDHDMDGYTQPPEDFVVQKPEPDCHLGIVEAMNEHFNALKDRHIPPYAPRQEEIHADDGRCDVSTARIHSFEPDTTESMKPLSSSPTTPEDIIVFMRWMEYLIDSCGHRGLPSILDYYVDIGWITEDVRLDVIKYSKGITPVSCEPDGKEACKTMTTRDHIQSLLFIQRLCGNELDKNFLGRIDRQIIKMGTQKMDV